MMKEIEKLPTRPHEITGSEAATGASDIALREGLACLAEEAVPHQVGHYKGRDVAMAAMAEFARGMARRGSLSRS
jgi:catalase